MIKLFGKREKKIDQSVDRSKMNKLVIEQINKGEKILAIKLVREFYDVDLAKAKKYVDELERNSHLQPFNHIKNKNDQELIQLIHEGKKIRAIKLAREQYRFGLAEAKKYVDELEQNDLT